jgi:hypothetical protein
MGHGHAPFVGETVRDPGRFVWVKKGSRCEHRAGKCRCPRAASIETTRVFPVGEGYGRPGRERWWR